MGEAWNQKELDRITMRRAKKRMDLEGERGQRPGQTELERKLRDTGREILGKRGANFGLQGNGVLGQKIREEDGCVLQM